MKSSDDTVKRKRNAGSFKSFYSFGVVEKIISIYGIDSDIYKALASGEFISGMIKADIRKKGKGSGYRIVEKKKLMVLILDEEVKQLEKITSDANV